MKRPRAHKHKFEFIGKYPAKGPHHAWLMNFYTWKCKCGEVIQSSLPYRDEYGPVLPELISEGLATQPLKE